MRDGREPLALRRIVSALIIVALASAVLGTVPISAQTDAESVDPSCDDAIFDEQWEQASASLLEGLAYTAAVHDTRTGCWYHLNPQLRLTTASAIKLQVLTANLERAQRLGRPLTDAELEAAQRMLWYSHNNPATSLLYEQVGPGGMGAISNAVDATNTTHSWVYGITQTAAEDLSKVALATLNLELPSPLTEASRRVARDLLADVHFTQRWGISAGLPEDHDVWLKNGFFPCTRCGPFSGTTTWRVASTGYIERPDGTGWAISVLTDGASTQQQGSVAVETIAREVAHALADGAAALRPLENANCITVEAGEGSTSITQRLGLPATDWNDVRWVSGNEGPMTGQLMCGPQPIDSGHACICPPRQRR